MESSHLQTVSGPSASSSAPAGEVIASLETRLTRLEYLVNGHHQQNGTIAEDTTRSSASVRLRNLERRLQSLVNDSATGADVLALVKQQPNVLSQSSSPATPSATTLTALVLAHAQLITSVSASLAQLQEMSVPDSAALARLIDLQPRIDQVAATQERQAREVVDLRTRSAKAVEHWYEVGVLDMGERWADWEERVKEAEILVRRNESARKREAGTV